MSNTLRKRSQTASLVLRKSARLNVLSQSHHRRDRHWARESSCIRCTRKARASLSTRVARVVLLRHWTSLCEKCGFRERSPRRRGTRSRGQEGRPLARAKRLFTILPRVLRVSQVTWESCRVLMPLITLHACVCARWCNFYVCNIACHRGAWPIVVTRWKKRERRRRVCAIVPKG